MLCDDWSGALNPYVLWRTFAETVRTSCRRMVEAVKDFPVQAHYKLAYIYYSAGIRLFSVVILFLPLIIGVSGLVLYRYIFYQVITSVKLWFFSGMTIALTVASFLSWAMWSSYKHAEGEAEPSGPGWRFCKTLSSGTFVVAIIAAIWLLYGTQKAIYGDLHFGAPEHRDAQGGTFADTPLQKK